MGADVTSRPVVVTGGGSGIGAALAAEAGKRGASSVHVTDVDEAAAAATAERLVADGIHAVSHQLDVTDPAAVEDMARAIADRVGVPALVCANAGVMAPSARLLETDPSDAAWILSVNTLGVVHTLQSFGRVMVADEAGGWLIATGSEHSLGVPHPRAAPYTASKHAVLGLSDVLRSELPDHVGISVVCPGLTTSRLWDARRQRPDEYGGAHPGDARTEAFMEQVGMDPSVVAERAISGAVEGHFLIPTHYNANEYAARRAAETAEAFARLEQIDTTDYDVRRLSRQGAS